MKLIATWSFFLLVGISAKSQGANKAPDDLVSQTNCPSKYERLDKTMVQMLPGNGGCFLTVNPRGGSGMVYRDFLFDEAGLFMIFNSFGNGNEASSTGARELYFFPRTNTPLSYQYEATAKRLKVFSPNGKVFTFDTEKTILVEISDAKISIDYEVHPGNNGGIEILQNQGLFLDLGFQIGQSPAQNPQRKITFKDSQNNSCTMKNVDVFKYTYDGEVNLRYSDEQLLRLLKRSCSQLVL